MPGILQLLNGYLKCFFDPVYTARVFHKQKIFFSYRVQKEAPPLY